MPFLVDGNVLSEATRPDPDEKVVRWLRANEEELVVDPIILGELHAGILFLPKGRKRRNLEAWFHDVANSIHCLDWNAQTALHWSRLLAELRAKGRTVPLGGLYRGVSFAYLSTDEDLKATTEIFDWPDGLVQEPDAVYPAEAG